MIDAPTVQKKLRKGEPLSLGLSLSLSLSLALSEPDEGGRSMNTLGYMHNTNSVQCCFETCLRGQDSQNEDPSLSAYMPTGHALQGAVPASIENFLE